MIKYNYDGRELVLSKKEYTDGHTAIIISENGKEIDRLSTNFDAKECKRAFGRDLKETEILICMTPSYEHPIIRSLALSLEEDEIINCWYDFIRTWNEYYRYSIPSEMFEKIKAEEIIEFVPEEYYEEEWGEW